MKNRSIATIKPLVKPLALCFCAFAPWVSAYADDPETELGTEQQLNEVTVEAKYSRVIDEGIEYMPSPAVKAASFDVYSMLQLMPMTNVVCVTGKKEIKTYNEEGYTIYINGHEADIWEIALLQPKDILSFEVLSNPTKAEYQGKPHVINIRVRVYKYGGYALMSADQNFFNQYNDSYVLGARFDTDKWCFAATVSTNLSKGNNVGDSEITYIFPQDDGTDKIVSQLSEEALKYRSNKETAIAKAWRNTDKFTQTHEMGYSRSATPYYHTSGVSAYNVYEDYAPTPTSDDFNSNSHTIYYKFNGLFPKISERSYLITEFFANYARSKFNNLHRLEHPTDPVVIANNSNNEQFLASALLYYVVNFTPTRVLHASLYSKYTDTNNDYSGNYPTSINRGLYNNKLSIVYQDKFGDLRTSVMADLPLDTYTSDLIKTKTFFTPKITVRFSYSISNNNRLDLMCQYKAEPISSYNYDGVSRIVNELNGYAPNYDAKTQHSIFSTLGYSHNFSQKFTIYPSVMFSYRRNAETELYAPIDGIMYSSSSNDGNETSISIGTFAQYRTSAANFSCHAGPRYNYEQRSGFNHFHNNGFTLDFGASCIPVKRWSIWLNGTYSLKEWVHCGRFDYKNEHTLRMTLGTSYSIKNLSFSAEVTSPWFAHNTMYIRRNFKYYRSYSSNVSSGDFNVRHLVLSMRYTFDFGRRTDHNDNLRFQGVGVGNM